ncbi:MAG: phytoene/squalene synthase family protein [Chloroflexota bacterium]
MEHNTIHSFVSAPAVISPRPYRWPHVAPSVSPPSSKQVLEQLSEYLTPPVSQVRPSKAQIRSGAYDRMSTTYMAVEQRPHPSMLWAYKACTEVIRNHSKSFYFSARLLPAQKQHGIMALYAFCRLSDDMVDEADAGGEQNGTRESATEALQQWAWTNHMPSPDEKNPVVVAWADTRNRYAIPDALPNELIAGVRMDLTIDRYETWNDLWIYGYRVASTVGLMSMYITGAETMDAVPYAVQLGVALQLTNILRDVGEDARDGRIYLPQEDMARFGYTEEMLLSGVINRQFINLMQFEIERAAALYDAAWPGIAMLPADSRVAVAAASTVYRGILDKIVASGYDVFNHRASLSMTEKVRALPGIWWKSKQIKTNMEI